MRSGENLDAQGMPSYLASRTGQQDEQAPTQPPIGVQNYQRALQHADRACCCSAQPLVIAVLPPHASRPHPTELLFCRHHYRDLCVPLAVAGAACFDIHGVVVTSADAPIPVN